MVDLLYAPDFYIFCVVVSLAEMGCYWFISFFWSGYLNVFVHPNV